MITMDPNDLLIFANVAELGSFSRAAEHLGLPKSTVSRRITLLEEQLGERLMLRTTRKLTLTEFGYSLLHHARHVAEEVDAALALAEHRQVRPSGRLRISMPGDFANVLLVDLLAAFTALHPGVSLDIDLSPRRVDLIGENFDLALRMGDLPDDSSLAARKVGVFSSNLYAAPDYLREHGTPAQPSDLMAHASLRLASRSGEPLDWILRNDATEVRINPPARIIANSPELLIRLAASGSGIAAVPNQYAAPFVARLQLVRVLPGWCLPAVDCWAVFPGRRLMPAKTRAFLDMLANAPGISRS
ncbi:MAG: LysR family transcriptional regulator [Rhodocyclaceae bacterium]|nr:LysR family transcriptional regulator [Rhodocyclaceae bacterium]